MRRRRDVLLSGAMAIGAWLKTTSVLRKLSLQHNRIRDAGAGPERRADRRSPETSASETSTRNPKPPLALPHSCNGDALASARGLALPVRSLAVARLALRCGTTSGARGPLSVRMYSFGNGGRYCSCARGASVGVSGRVRCRVERSPSADVAGVGPVPAQM